MTYRSGICRCGDAETRRFLRLVKTIIHIYDSLSGPMMSTNGLSTLEKRRRYWIFWAIHKLTHPLVYYIVGASTRNHSFRQWHRLELTCARLISQDSSAHAAGAHVFLSKYVWSYSVSTNKVSICIKLFVHGPVLIQLIK